MKRSGIIAGLFLWVAAVAWSSDPGPAFAMPAAGGNATTPALTPYEQLAAWYDQGVPASFQDIAKSDFQTGRAFDSITSPSRRP